MSSLKHRARGMAAGDWAQVSAGVRKHDTSMIPKWPEIILNIRYDPKKKKTVDDDGFFFILKKSKKQICVYCDNEWSLRGLVCLFIDMQIKHGRKTIYRAERDQLHIETVKCQNSAIHEIKCLKTANSIG